MDRLGRDADERVFIESAEVDKIPQTYITLESEEDIKNMNLLLEHLDDNDDVQEVYHNWENAE